jgi:hypothetical protein
MGQLPGWLSGTGGRKTNNRKSREYERRLARDTGGRTSAGSGSSWRAPEDVRSDTHLIQHKFTGKRSFILTVTELERVFTNARRAGREGAIVIDFESVGLRVTVTEG